MSAPVQDGPSAATGALELWGDLALADPWFLVLIPVALVALALGRGRRARAAGRAPVLPAGGLPRSLRQTLAWLPAALQGLALVLVVLALARPLRGEVEQIDTSEGVDIALVIDRSSSMQHGDLDPERARSRLAVVKEVVGDFARRRMTDREGAADNVALFTFARFPQLLCPFTLDVGALEAFLETVELVRYNEEDGTGIGVALAKAVAVLRESEAKSRVVVLLTDGENNIDDIAPNEAAELAAEEGVKVYTVLAGRYQYHQTHFGGWQELDLRLDTGELEAIAEMTGGQFFEARDRQALEDVYAQIERLERTPREEQRRVESFDLYVWLLLPAAALYLFAWLSIGTWARRLP